MASACRRVGAPARSMVDGRSVGDGGLASTPQQSPRSSATTNGVYLIATARPSSPNDAIARTRHVGRIPVPTSSTHAAPSRRRFTRMSPGCPLPTPYLAVAQPLPTGGQTSRRTPASFELANSCHRADGCDPFAVTETPNSREHGRKPLARSPAFTGTFARFRWPSRNLKVLPLSGRYLNHETVEVIGRLHRTL